ncbi:hypothetical protein B0H11DRAFT_2201684 [Mycena galericulata]|nr:hypothetical protein B0H11DRAFT_2201684 [Mycena galericulata]
MSPSWTLSVRRFSRILCGQMPYGPLHSVVANTTVIMLVYVGLWGAMKMYSQSFLGYEGLWWSMKTCNHVPSVPTTAAVLFKPQSSVTNITPAFLHMVSFGLHSTVGPIWLPLAMSSNAASAPDQESSPPSKI